MADKRDIIDVRAALWKRRVTVWTILWSVFSTLVSLVVLGGGLAALFLLYHPKTPLSDEMNPTVPLAVSDPVSSLTSWKMRRVLSDPAQCLAVVNAAAQADPLPAISESGNCYVRNRVNLTQVGQADIEDVGTSCAIALRMAMWEHHGIQPAARDILGTDVTNIRQIGSYNCRLVRTANGEGRRYSTHATGEAIDITGFDFANGRRVRLIEDWDGAGAEAEFLRAVRDSACEWFVTTLGPDYNSLHEDHFHLQSRGWGACR